MSTFELIGRREANPGIDPVRKAQVDALQLRPAWRRRAALGRDIPRFLYKYFSFNPAVELDLAKVRGVVVDNEIFLASPGSFNDPFDFRYNPVVGSYEAFRDHMYRTAFTHTPKAERAEAMRNAMANYHRPELLRQIMDKIANNHGVCCFSANPRDIQMWSHYGDSHRGLCVQFASSEDLHVLPLARPIEYSDDFLKLRWPEDSRRIVEAIFRKFRNWAHEREYRLVVPSAPNVRMQLLDKAATGLLVGYRFPPDRLDALAKLLKERRERGLPGLKLYRVGRSEDSYRMRIERFQLPAPLAA